MKVLNNYEGFWIGRSWVSRCRRCGHICFDVAQEEEHSRETCCKRELLQLRDEETANPPGEQR